ncbi:DUF1542 domain-containing protein [Lactovum odontotermitis]
MIKKRKKATFSRKVSVFLLGATATTVALTAPAALSHIILNSDGLVAYAQTVSSDNISKTATTPSGQGVPFTLNNSAAYATSTAYRDASKDSGGTTDAAGGRWMNLIPNSPYKAGYVMQNQTFSAYADFHIDGYLGADRLTNNSGDWVGIDLMGNTTPADAASKGETGGGLGIRGIANSIGFGFDLHQNVGGPYYDPATPYVGMRWTGDGTALNNFTNRENLFNNNNIAGWNSHNIKYTLDYHYPGNPGGQYFTGSFDDGAGHTWSFDTRNSGSAGALGIAIPSDGYWSLGLGAASGEQYQGFYGSIDNVSGTAATSTGTVSYKVDPNVTTLPAGTTGNSTVAPNSTVKSGLADTIGIAGVSDGAKNGIDTYTYTADAAALTGVNAQYASGWHPSRTINTSTGAHGTWSDLYFEKNAANNTWTIFYAPDYQESNVVTDATDPTGAKTLDTVKGITGGNISGWTKTDADLARTGYGYTVKGPDGNIYSTLAAAQAAAANKTFDSTSNGAAATDSAPQNFVVTYNRGFQQAIVKSISNGDSSTSKTIATYDTTTTPDKPLENGTTGTLMSKVDDSALAKSGYTYTVTAPNGTTYPTMQAAWAATNTWDLTPNGPGATTDSNPQVWTVNYTGQTQTAVVTQSSTDGSIPDGTKETATGPSDTNIAFNTTDNNLVVVGYNYVVNVYDGNGNLLGTYQTLSQAVTANPKFDSSATDGTSDKQSQKFSVLYTPLDDNITNNFVDNKGNVILQPTTSQGKTNSTIDTSNHPTIPGYVFVQVDPSSDTRVKSDGTSQVTYIYQIDPAIITAANNAETAAKTSNVNNEPSVASAENNLQSILDNPKSTPQQIQDATTALNDAVTQAKADRQTAVNDANSANTAAKNSPVANEPGVQQAEQNLQNVLNNPASTTQQIKDATSALESAVVNAVADRNTAINNGENAIESAKSGSVANDPNVANAENNLQNVINNPNSTTQQITDATNALTNAVSQAGIDKGTAIANASDALGKTAPVSNEPAVKDAASNLKTVLNNPSSSAQQITDATNALNTAVAAANTARNGANTDANTAVTNAKSSTAQNDPAVQDAIQKLQQIQQAAAGDSANDLTQNIKDATSALNQAVSDAVAKQSAAKQNAQTAISNTKPVSNESNVKSELTDLNNVLNDPNATDTAIQTAVDQLNSAVQSAKTDRDAAVSAANAEISHIQADPTDSADPTVQAKIKALQDIMTNAANDDPAALTQQIIDATRDLDTTASSVTAAHTAAVANATSTIQKTAPVSNEAAVKQAITDLNSAISDPAHQTDDIVAKTTALQNAIDTANTARTAANTAGNNAITAAQADTTAANDPAVKAAITDLQNTIAEAAADSPTDLTQDIINKTNALNTAVTAADSGNGDARTAAQTAIANTSPVSNEPAVSTLKQQLQAALDDPASTTDQIKALTDSLTSTTAAEKSRRDQIITDSQTNITDAQKSPVSNEQPVQDAITALQNVIDKSKTDVPDALTKDIAAAKTALQEAQTQAQAARDKAVSDANTAIDNAEGTGRTDETNVSNEQPVKDAADNLQKVLNNPASTTKQIQDATTALNDAVTQAQAARQNAVDGANQAITNADNSNVSQEPAVTGAETDLKNVLNDPNSTTQNIQTATDALNTAVTQAQTDRQAAVDKANQAIADADASNVANEPSVASAEDALKKIKDDPTSTIQQITDATNALNNAVAQAKTDRQNAVDKGNQAVTNANNSPAANDPTVTQAKSDLQAVLDNPASTTQQITDATNNLNNAVGDASSGRDQAVTDANYAMDPANTSPVSHEPAVAQAISSLQALVADPNSTAAQIQNGTSALTAAVANAKTARDSAITDANTVETTVKNSTSAQEPGVVAAMKTLDDLIAKSQTDSSDALTKDITAATQALQDALKTAQDARDKGAQAVTDANNSPAANDPAVTKAKDDLQTALDNPASSTQQITDATDNLNNAVSDSQKGRDAAVTDANTAIANAAPVSYEPAVAQAISDLKTLVNNPNSTVSQIEDGVRTLNTAVTAAKTARDAAITNANTVEDSVNKSSSAQEPSVVAAMNNLNNVIAKSKTDDATALTKDITAAIQTLQDAQKAAQDARNNGAQAIIIAKDSPLANDPTVAKDISDLQTLLDNPASPTQAIINATNTLNNAVSDGSKSRQDAVNDANTALANTSPVSYEPAVAQAITDLKTQVSNPNSTVTQIEDAVRALNAAVTDAKTARDAAITAANGVEDTVRKSSSAQEPSVVSAMKALDDLIAKSKTDSSDALTKDITAAIQTLQNTLKTAQDVRDKGNQAVTDADKSPVANDPAVTSAENNLKNVLNNPASSNQQITDATTALTTAVNTATDATKTRDDAVNDANTAIANTSPVSYEPAVAQAISALKTQVSNPSSTVTQIEDAVRALNTAVADAKKARDAAITTATGVEDTVRKSSSAQEPSVVSAMKNLDDLIAKSKTDSSDALTKDITAAIQTLQNALKTAQDTRDKGNQAVTNADKSNVAKEPSVVTAENNLKNILNVPTSTNQQITDATTALNTAVTQAQTDRQNAVDKGNQAITNADKSNVAKEPSVVTAENNLKNTLNNPASSTQQITDATTALNTAVTQAQTDRQNAVDKGNQAVDNANNSPVANDPTVVKDKNDLQVIINNPASSTQQIKDATDKLNNTVNDASKNHDDAVNDGKTALEPSNTSPVTYEPTVVIAITNLQTLINDPSSSVSQIEDGVRALNTAIADAKAARDAAIAAANTIKTTASQFSVSQSSAVTDALNKLNDLIAKAQKGDPSALTSDIKKASQTLQDAVTAATAGTTGTTSGTTTSTTSGKNLPNTGDASENLAMGLGLSLLGATSFSMVRGKRRKKREN